MITESANEDDTVYMVELAYGAAGSKVLLVHFRYFIYTT